MRPNILNQLALELREAAMTAERIKKMAQCGQVMPELASLCDETINLEIKAEPLLELAERRILEETVEV